MQATGGAGGVGVVHIHLLDGQIGQTRHVSLDKAFPSLDRPSAEIVSKISQTREALIHALNAFSPSSSSSSSSSPLVSALSSLSSSSTSLTSSSSSPSAAHSASLCPTAAAALFLSPEPALKAAETYLPCVLGLLAATRPLASAEFFRALRLPWMSVLNVNHTRAPVSFDSFDWEIINVLLTIGLLYRSCAYGKLRVTTTETFDVNSKEIARLLCVAAGIFEHIRDEWLPRFKGVRIEEAITELTPETYTALASISLAEAQEVSVRKAMIGGMSEGALAKLCIEISRQFGAAMSCIKNVPAGENFPESFRAYMAYSQALFAAISLKHQAKEAHAKGQYGIAVGLMQKAKNRLPEEPKRWDTILTPFFEAYKMERAEILRLAQSFKTHNDRVYYDTVPDEASLPVLTEGKMLMRPIPYQLPEPLPVEINCIKDSSCVLQ